MPRSEALKQAQKRYRTSEKGKAAAYALSRRNSRSFSFQFALSTDEDIITWLDSLDNKQGTIKQVIREYIARQSS